MRRQRTIYVGNRKITIISKPKTNLKNLVGWYVWINRVKFFVSCLTREQAEDTCYAQWVKTQ
jgi:hypothetical protein